MTAGGDVAALAARLEQAPARAAGPRPVGVLMSEVQPERVEWLWRGRVPLGKLSILDGDPGLGKSCISVDLVSRVTTGGVMPDGSPGIDGGAVIVTAEDGLADTVRPRLDLHGADCSRVVALKTVGVGDDTRTVELPADLGALRLAIARVGARLVVVDPIMAVLNGAVDSHRDQDVRRVLAALAAMAEETGAAVLIVRHLNKTAGGNPLYRGGGSIAFVGAARSAMVVGRNPDGGDGCVLAMTKANLSKMGPSLGYVVDEVDEVPRVRWLGEAAFSAGELLAAAGGSRGGPRGDAMEFLREILAGGPVAAREVFEAADDAGIAAKTLKRAKAELGVEAVKHGAPGESGAWVWSLRRGPEGGHTEKWPPSGKSGPLRPVVL